MSCQIDADLSEIKDNLESVHNQQQALSDTYNHAISGKAFDLYNANLLPLILSLLQTDLLKTTTIITNMLTYTTQKECLQIPLPLFAQLPQLSDTTLPVQEIIALLDKSLVKALDPCVEEQEPFATTRQEYDVFLSYSSDKYPSYPFPHPHEYHLTAVEPTVQPFLSTVPQLPAPFAQAVEIYEKNLKLPRQKSDEDVDLFYSQLHSSLPLYVTTLVRLLYYINLHDKQPQSADVSVGITNILLSLLNGLVQYSAFALIQIACTRNTFRNCS